MSDEQTVFCTTCYSPLTDTDQGMWCRECSVITSFALYAEGVSEAARNLRAEVERLREFAETIIAACVPMEPPADNPVPLVIADVFVTLANKALGREVIA